MMAVAGARLARAGVVGGTARGTSRCASAAVVAVAVAAGECWSLRTRAAAVAGVRQRDGYAARGLHSSMVRRRGSSATATAAAVAGRGSGQLPEGVRVIEAAAATLGSREVLEEVVPALQAFASHGTKISHDAGIDEHLGAASSSASANLRRRRAMEKGRVDGSDGRPTSLAFGVHQTAILAGGKLNSALPKARVAITSALDGSTFDSGFADALRHFDAAQITEHLVSSRRLAFLFASAATRGLLFMFNGSCVPPSHRFALRAARLYRCLSVASRTTAAT